MECDPGPRNNMDQNLVCVVLNNLMCKERKQEDEVLLYMALCEYVRNMVHYESELLKVKIREVERYNEETEDDDT